MATKTSADTASSDRALQKFVSGPFFNFINRFKYFFLVFWALVIIGASVSAAVGLKTASEPPTFGSQDNMFVRWVTVNDHYFPTAATPSQVRVMWGLDTEDPVMEYDDAGVATPRFSSDYAAQAVSKEGQQKVLDLCQSPDIDTTLRCKKDSCLVSGKITTSRCKRDEAIWNATQIYIPDETECHNGRYCIMELVKEYADRENIPFPLGDFWGVIGNESFRGAVFNKSFVEFAKQKGELHVAKGSHWEKENFEKNTGIRWNGKQAGFIFATFNATYPLVPAMSQALEVHEKWEDLMKKYALGTGAVQACDMYQFMRLQQELFSSAMLGVISSTLVALVVLIFVTFNWAIALIGGFTISCILVTFIGAVPLFGWEVGVYESIFLIMTVGLSVDYTVHLLHAYNDSSGLTREDRVRDCLQSTGITVLSGSATTLLAAIPLFSCLLRFFQQYGVFIFFVILFSILCAILLLPPILLCVGPVGKQGDIACLFALHKKCQRSQDTTRAPPQDALHAVLWCLRREKPTDVQVVAPAEFAEAPTVVET